MTRRTTLVSACAVTAAIAACAATTAIAAPSLAQPQRIARADPYHAFLVEGRVLGPGDLPVHGVVVERVRDATDDTPYSSAYRVVTDARGAFRFEHHGLGVSTGRTWYLAVRRAGCRAAIHTVSLERTSVPGGRDGDVALRRSAARGRVHRGCTRALTSRTDEARSCGERARDDATSGCSPEEWPSGRWQRS